jgi:hypothetical protein
MEFTSKEIRRAQIKLLKQAEVEAADRQTTVEAALISLLERGEDQDLIIKAFSKMPEGGKKEPVKIKAPASTDGTSGHTRDAAAGISVYFDEAT